jgi:hypothetical protein
MSAPAMAAAEAAQSDHAPLQLQAPCRSHISNIHPATPKALCSLQQQRRSRRRPRATCHHTAVCTEIHRASRTPISPHGIIFAMHRQAPCTLRGQQRSRPRPRPPPGVTRPAAAAGEPLHFAASRAPILPIPKPCAACCRSGEHTGGRVPHTLKSRRALSLPPSLGISSIPQRQAPRHVQQHTTPQWSPWAAWQSWCRGLPS